MSSEPRTDASDPTKSILAESGLNKKALCDYALNVATGCTHGCRFCYVPATPNISTRPDMLESVMNVTDPQEQWGEYVAYRDDIPPRLDQTLHRKRTWKETHRGQGVVGVSYSTDCFMDRRAGAITAGVIRTLADHGKYVRVQTRNPVLAANGKPPDTIQVDGEPVQYPWGIALTGDDGEPDQDLDVHRGAFHPPDEPFMTAFQDAGDHVTVGASINCLDADQVLALEPNVPPQARLRGLEAFRDAGVSVFVSMSPTYPTMDREDIRALMTRLADLDPDVVFHEPVNPRGINFQMTVDAAEAAGEHELAAELAKLRKRDRWTEYSIRHLAWVQELAVELDVPVHLWPDADLLNRTDGEVTEWLETWRSRGSPESFAKRPNPGPYPEIPEVVGPRI